MESDAALRLGEADGPPNPRQGHLRQALGEDAARAPGGGAAKATDLKLKVTDPALPGEIPKAANVAAVDATRAAPAQGTGRCGGASANGHDDAIRVDDDPLNRETGGEQG